MLGNKPLIIIQVRKITCFEISRPSNTDVVITYGTRSLSCCIGRGAGGKKIILPPIKRYLLTTIFYTVREQKANSKQDLLVTDFASRIWRKHKVQGKIRPQTYLGINRNFNRITKHPNLRTFCQLSRRSKAPRSRMN